MSLPILQAANLAQAAYTTNLYSTKLWRLQFSEQRVGTAGSGKDPSPGYDLTQLFSGMNAECSVFNLL